MQSNPVDLSELTRISEANRKLREEAEDRRETEEAERRVRAWDRAMQRAFKGIMPRRSRQYLLAVALERYERGEL